nr:hypothetical protein Iba_chr11bCG14310 [Ipomoea batatas]
MVGWWLWLYIVHNDSLAGKFAASVANNCPSAMMMLPPYSEIWDLLDWVWYVAMNCGQSIGRGIGFRQLLEVMEDWRLDCWRLGGWMPGWLDLCCCLLTWKSGIVNE